MDTRHSDTMTPPGSPASPCKARISVVIRTFTQDDEIFHLLTRLAEQTVQPWEFVVIDSGSAPRVQERLRALCQGTEHPDNTRLTTPWQPLGGLHAA